MEISPWFVLLLGMGTVFVGLLSIILLTKLMSSVMAAKTQPAATPLPAQNAPAAPVQQNAFPIADRACFDAVVAAAIASYTGTKASGLRIHSIKPLSSSTEDSEAHGQFVAAVAGAIATATGTTASGLRIHSIRKL